MPCATAPRGIAADIVVESGKISAILTDDTPRPEDAEVIDARCCALIPGLINGHTHAHNNLLKGLGDRWTLEMSLTQAPALVQGRDLEMTYASAAIGAAEMLLKGCTACYDLSFEYPMPSVVGLDAVAQAYSDVGMRAVIAPMVADTAFLDAIPGLRQALAEQGLASDATDPDSTDILARLGEQLHGWAWPRDRIRMALGPTIPLLCSDSFIIGCRDLARDHGCGIHTHLCESKVQSVAGLQRYGRSIPAHLAGLDMLAPNLTCAHAVWLTADDRRRLADSGAVVVHNPGSNFRLGSGTADVHAMAAAGISVGLGTDGATCADSLNMFEAMRLMTHASRTFGAPHETWMNAADALSAATSGSAKALGFGDEIGRIAVGAQADLVILDLMRPHYAPLNDLTSQIVYGEDSSGVRDVFVGGRCVVRDRKLTTIDYPRLVNRVNADALALEARSADARFLARRIASVAATFCHGLIRQNHGVQAYVDTACTGVSNSGCDGL
jgi:guanine deaminase